MSFFVSKLSSPSCLSLFTQERFSSPNTIFVSFEVYGWLLLLNNELFHIMRPFFFFFQKSYPFFIGLVTHCGNIFCDLFVSNSFDHLFKSKHYQWQTYCLQGNDCHNLFVFVYAFFSCAQKIPGLLLYIIRVYVTLNMKLLFSPACVELSFHLLYHLLFYNLFVHSFTYNSS